jgi:hypothetical protein
MDSSTFFPKTIYRKLAVKLSSLFGLIIFLPDLLRHIAAHITDVWEISFMALDMKFFSSGSSKLSYVDDNMDIDVLKRLIGFSWDEFLDM